MIEQGVFVYRTDASAGPVRIPLDPNATAIKDEDVSLAAKLILDMLLQPRSER